MPARPARRLETGLERGRNVPWCGFEIVPEFCDSFMQGFRGRLGLSHGGVHGHGSALFTVASDREEAFD